MGIKEKVGLDGTKTYEVSVHIRSNVNRRFRSQKKKAGIKTLKEAQNVEKDLIRDCSIDVARQEGSGLPWADLLEKYELTHRKGGIGVKKIQTSTIWDTIATLRRFTSSWDNKMCNELNAGDARKVLQAMLEQGYSRSRLRAVKSAINTIFKWGIEEGAIMGVRHSPAFDIQLGKYHDDKPPQILSLHEIQKLLDVAKEMDHEWYPIWFMALHTGMRSGELFALEWNDIDFESKMITCSKSYNGRMKIIKSTKAGYWRKIPMNKEIEAKLVDLRAQGNHDNIHVLPRINKWRRGEAARVLREFCESIGVHSVNFHALRACFATHLLNAGVSSPVVKKICGWTDEKVMTRYIRLAGIDVRGATEGLNFVLPEIGEKKVASLTDFRMAKKYVPNRDEEL
ncbi:MAG: site-specific integrase [Bdellovibrionales bacterium]|nr:site-specific integrase [Bdellovibrionales bacterium]